jgi:hypothetical protein
MAPGARLAFQSRELSAATRGAPTGQQLRINLFMDHLACFTPADLAGSSA